MFVLQTTVQKTMLDRLLGIWKKVKDHNGRDQHSHLGKHTAESSYLAEVKHEALYFSSTTLIWLYSNKS